MSERPLTFTGPVAMIGGEAAFVLAGILAGSLRGRLSLRALLEDIDLDPGRQALALEAQLALASAGESWRAQFPQRGNAATRGNDDGLLWEDDVVTVTVEAAAALLQRTPRRVRQYAAAGDIPADKTALGWRFRRDDVVGFRAARR